ncbi:MAG: hypothetical protein EZS28_013494 [Streblomastix strix]|uniref:Uncharacterized protein n=1 Tax=Streblomastix strix TaxID=222440 RepID=A0A5J4W808_9EUKA|nr:MAG: hypothetical protein EZS28_013494 [Streblomastix strix]
MLVQKTIWNVKSESKSFTVKDISKLREGTVRCIRGVIILQLKFELEEEKSQRELVFQIADPELPDIKCTICCIGSFAQNYSNYLQPWDIIDIYPSYVKIGRKLNNTVSYSLVLDDAQETAYDDGRQVGLFLIRRMQHKIDNVEDDIYTEYHDLHLYENDINVSIAGLLLGYNANELNKKPKEEVIILSCYGDTLQKINDAQIGKDCISVSNVKVIIHFNKVQCETTSRSVIVLNPKGVYISKFQQKQL